MSATEPDKGQPEERSRDRSPPFPFIPLSKAVDRTREFESQYRRSAGRVANVVPIWGFSAKSSGGMQTIAALKAFGLIEDEGTGADRKVKLSDLAIRILKDERPGKREEAVKEAALKPKPLAEHWQLWGANRPPDQECWSELTIERGYTEEAASRFLRVYDDTVAYAQLGGAADSISDKQERQDLPPGGRAIPRHSAGQSEFKSFIPQWVGQQNASTMSERIVFAQEIDPPQAIKLLVTGPVDEAVLDALDGFVQLQRMRLQRAKHVKVSEAGSQSPAEEEASDS